MLPKLISKYKVTKTAEIYEFHINFMIQLSLDIELYNYIKRDHNLYFKHNLYKMTMI